MAQTTSDLWKSLIRNNNVSREYAFDINGIWYGEDSEVSHNSTGELFTKFGIGNASSKALNLVIETNEIPKGATIKRYVRLVSGDQVSEWLPKGVFYTNRRSEKDGIWTIEAFDALRKTTPKYVQEGVQEEWPQQADKVVESIANRIGVAIDSRTVIDPAIMVEYPDDRTMQAVLANIAAAHIGNFIMSDAGELLLVPLLSIPAETSLLVNEDGDYISFGGVRIRV